MKITTRAARLGRKVYADGDYIGRISRDDFTGFWSATSGGIKLGSTFSTKRAAVAAIVARTQKPETA